MFEGGSQSFLLKANLVQISLEGRNGRKLMMMMMVGGCVLFVESSSGNQVDGL